MSEIIVYSTPDGGKRIEVLHEEETLWATQRQLADLFGVDVRTVNEHLINVYETAELDRDRTIRKIRIVRTEGTREVAREIEHYSLDAIISVGYRVNSGEATQFRIWATRTLREFITKGFVLDDERLKLNVRFGRDYFDELLERIREIRTSERRFYLKITDLYEAASVDYDKDSPLTRAFFKTVQNKFHWAVFGRTAAELIRDRADAERPHMGLTSWKNGPDGRVIKSDVDVAKNYLTREELDGLNRVVEQYLLFAESQAARGIAMRMADWIPRLDAFLEFNGYEALNGAGGFSMEAAQKHAHGQYEKFHQEQDRTFLSDFEREVKRIEGKRP